MSQPIIRRLHSHETPSQIAKIGYDEHAQTYLDWTSSKPGSRLKYLNQVITFLSQNQDQEDHHIPQVPTTKTSQGNSVLDLGCGAGVPVTLCLAKSDTVQNVIATDISQTQLELFRQRLRDDKSISEQKVEVIESDMLDLAFEKGAFSGVVAFFSLIHLAREDQKLMLNRIWGWLEAGGYLCANFGAQIDREVREKGDAETGTGTGTGNVVEGWLGMNAYWDGYGVEETKSILKEAGFELVVADVVEEVGDAKFLWVIAQKPSSS